MVQNAVVQKGQGHSSKSLTSHTTLRLLVLNKYKKFDVDAMDIFRDMEEQSQR